MTGLEKITAQIKLSAESTAESIMNNAKSQADEILINAHNEADEILKAGEALSQKKADDIIARASSTAELELRKITLLAKQEVIARMISSAYKSILSLAEDEYFELLYKMISKYSSSASGELYLNGKDLARLPEDFAQRVSLASKGELSLSDKAADIDGGFVLTYGGVDVNCSFSALFSENAEKISDKALKLLFA